MTFNDEELARAVAACPVPVVTGIGHEPDTSICDMVSDRRCSTPTAAAESVAPAMSDLIDVLETRQRRLAIAMGAQTRRAEEALDADAAALVRTMGARLERLRLALDAAARRPCLTDPAASLHRRVAELDQSAERLGTAIDRVQERFRADADRFAPRLAAAGASFGRRGHALDLMESRLGHAGHALVEGLGARLSAQAAALDALSPLKVLARGYAIAYGPQGVATSATQLAAGDELRVRLADGDVRAAVTDVTLTDARG